MAPIYLEFRTWDTRMEVGPSAAPMIPIEAASFRSNPRMVDSKIAAKIPSCAPAPNRNKEGLESRGPKSIIAPIPMKSKIGMTSEASIPAWNSHSMTPFAWIPPARVWFKTPEKGRFTSMAPKPIGRSRAGSNPFLIASQIRVIPTANITICCQVNARIPSVKNSISFSSFWVFECKCLNR